MPRDDKLQVANHMEGASVKIVNAHAHAKYSDQSTDSVSTEKQELFAQTREDLP